MAKLALLIFSLCIIGVAKTYPTFAENDAKNDMSDVSKGKSKQQFEDTRTTLVGKPVLSVYIEDSVQTKLSQQLIRSGRRKRSIINGGVCPAGQVWKPRPFFCITCEEYEELSGNDC